MNCRGEKNKQKILSKYFIKPLLHLGSLPNQVKDGCCGKLENEYYIL